MIFGLTDLEEFCLLRDIRECKSIIEVLQNYFFKNPSKAFKISEKESEYKSWIDISGKLTYNYVAVEKSYLVLYIKPHIKKYDKDGNIGNLKYSYYDSSSYKELRHYVKIGNKKSCIFNYKYFYFFVAFGLGGLYLIYVRYYIKIVDFNVKKIIHEKDDLNTMKKI